VTLPWGAPSPGATGGPAGYTYGAVAVRLTAPHDDLLAALRALRFTGWVAPTDDGGWTLAVAARAGGVVAAGGRGLVEVGAELARKLRTTVVAVRVLRDRQLVLAAWTGGDEVGRYVSDPSYGLDDETVLASPLGADDAAAFAAAARSPEAADDLEELLDEELDPESVIESERLAAVLRLLALPGWLVSAASLPRDVPGGPPARSFTRLGAGAPGVRGRLLGRAVDVVRRRRRAPAVVADPPRAGAGPDPWLF
jgi:hypothetical protein